MKHSIKEIRKAKKQCDRKIANWRNKGKNPLIEIYKELPK